MRGGVVAFGLDLRRDCESLLLIAALRVKFPFGGAKPVAIKELPSKAAEGEAPLEEKAAALEIKDE